MSTGIAGRDEAVAAESIRANASHFEAAFIGLGENRRAFKDSALGLFQEASAPKDQ